jgi:tetratricopeptide (TPR) repeat protein
MGVSRDDETFQVAVSVHEEHVTGMGATKQKQERVIYYYAEKKDATGVFIQPLNQNAFPSGEKTLVTDEEFFAKYRPEPLYFYNKVKVAMDAVESGLDKGQKALEHGRDNVAEKEFKKALAVDEKNVRAIFGLGTAYLSSDNKESALEVFEKIMSLEMSFSPRHKHMFNDFGMRLRKGGMFEQALQYYEKAAAQLKGDDENLYFNIGRANYDLKHYREAGEWLRKALSVNPGFAEAKKFLAGIDKYLDGEASQREEPTPGAV